MTSPVTPPQGDARKLAVKIWRRINTETRVGSNKVICPDDAVSVIAEELQRAQSPTHQALEDEITRLRLSLSIKDKALREARAAADNILAYVTMELGRYLYDAPDTDLIPLLAEAGVKITGKQFMALYTATSEQALAHTGGTDGT